MFYSLSPKLYHWTTLVLLLVTLLKPKFAPNVVRTYLWVIVKSSVITVITSLQLQIYHPSAPVFCHPSFATPTPSPSRATRRTRGRWPREEDSPSRARRCWSSLSTGPLHFRWARHVTHVATSGPSLPLHTTTPDPSRGDRGTWVTGGTMRDSNFRLDPINHVGGRKYIHNNHHRLWFYLWYQLNAQCLLLLLFTPPFENSMEMQVLLLETLLLMTPAVENSMDCRLFW